jgi:serine/threonine-protein kinase HipA
MKRTLDVLIGDDPRLVGKIEYEARGARERAAFEYGPEWLGAGDRFTVDPALQLVPGMQFRRRVPTGSIFHGAIADTEPDGWAKRVILRDHAKRRALTAVRPPALNQLDFLLAVDDLARVGALRFRDEEGVFRRASEPGRRTAPPLVDLGKVFAATRALETDTETAADLEYLLGRATSLGGLRPKCTVLEEDGQLAIGKFPSVADERAVTKGEVLALRLAERAKIDAAQGRLVMVDGVPVAVIRRFDRPPGGGRILYVSAATLMGVEPREPSEHAYTDIVDAIRIHGAAVQADVEELWRRMAFSILITNVDDHLLNHGFLHVARGQWRLAPAFDLNPFPARARELKIWISEEAGPEATIEGLLTVAPYFRLARKRAKVVLGEVERAVARWRVEGRAIGLTDAELVQLEAAFEHPERAAARRAAR